MLRKYQARQFIAHIISQSMHHSTLRPVCRYMHLWIVPSRPNHPMRRIELVVPKRTLDRSRVLFGTGPQSSLRPVPSPLWDQSRVLFGTSPECLEKIVHPTSIHFEICLAPPPILKNAMPPSPNMRTYCMLVPLPGPLLLSP